MPSGMPQFIFLHHRAENADQFYLAYRSLCPSAWVERWDDQRGETWCLHAVCAVLKLDIEKGTFPTRLDQ